MILKLFVRCYDPLAIQVSLLAKPYFVELKMFLCDEQSRGSTDSTPLMLGYGVAAIVLCSVGDACFVLSSVACLIMLRPNYMFLVFLAVCCDHLRE